MKKILIIVITFLGFLLQCSVFPHISLGGIVPNLMVFFVSVYGILYGERYGMVIGFVCGLVMDIFFLDFIGLNALILLYLGYLNGQFCGMFYPEDVRLPMGLILLSDLSYGILFYIFEFLMRGKLNFPYYLGHVILPEMLYTILAGLILYPILLGLYKIFEKRENRSN